MSDAEQRYPSPASGHFVDLANVLAVRDTGAMDLAPAVEEILREIPAVEAIYVFGSVARGEAGGESDVDLAVLAPGRLASEARWRLQERVASRLGRDVDLVDLRSASTVMQVQVLRDGEVIHDARPTARAFFETIALGAYARLNESRAGILADVKARGTVHG
jgi:predicted nucleotidyltransferase